MFGIKGVDNDSESLAVVRAAGPSDATANTIAALYPDILVTGIPAVLQGLPPSNTSHGYQWKRAAAFWSDLARHAPRRYVPKIAGSTECQHLNISPQHLGQQTECQDGCHSVSRGGILV
jgi:hypothetical protein